MRTYSRFLPLLLVLALATVMVACGGTETEVRTVEVEKIVEKVVVKEVPVEKVVVQEVVKEVPVEKVVVQEVPAPLTAGQKAEAARYGGTLKWIPGGSVASIDPQGTAALMLAQAFHIYDTLVAWDREGNIAPQMADAWEFEEGGKRLVMTLRDGLKFHDGNAVTIEDVIASIDRWREKDNYGKLFNQHMVEMKRMDEETFSVEFTQPQGIFLEGLSKPAGHYPVIMPKWQTEQGFPLETHIGSGPYKLTKWELGNTLIKDRFVDYEPRAEPPSYLAGGRNAYFDRLEMVEVPDQETRVAALITGQVDYLDTISGDFMGRLQSDEKVQVLVGRPGVKPVIYFNMARPPFDDTESGLKLRLAVQAMVDVEDFMRAFGPSQLWSLCGSIQACGSFYESKVGLENYNQNDLEKAKRLMKEAGYAGEPIIIPAPADYPTIRPTIVVLASQMEKAGFNVELRTFDTPGWLAVLQTKPLEEAPWHATGSWVGSGAIMPLATGLNAVPTAYGYDNPELLKVRLALAAETDPVKRKAFVDDMQRIYFEDMAFMYLADMFTIRAMSTDILGFDPSPLSGRVAYFIGLHFAPGKARR